jgi:hypothetical protein
MTMIESLHDVKQSDWALLIKRRNQTQKEREPPSTFENRYKLEEYLDYEKEIACFAQWVNIMYYPK